MTQTIQNISGYRFVALKELKPLRERLASLCRSLGLKGTILLASEGINLFVAGEGNAIERLLAFLHSVPGLEEFQAKFSESDHQPFSRMLVKIKKEIIAFGIDGIDPGQRTSPKISAHELKRWLDEGRPVTLYDTRNDYEVKLGTFDRAVPAGIRHFRDFPEAVRKLPADWKEKPIVMFCTGGIRCEKAGPFMEQEGFRHIFQLDGGILKYFEEVGGDHYHGECFVFDQRVGVDPTLHETPNSQCFVCWTPLTENDQRDPRYVDSKSCPYCFVPSEEQRTRTLAERHASLHRVTTPLPGSVTYENFRPVTVSAPYDGWKLVDFLADIFAHVAREEWQAICDRGGFLNVDRQPVPSSQIVRAGEYYLHHLPNTREPDVNADIRIVHEDEAIVVVVKPAPLPTHPSGRFNRNTLQSILTQVYRPQKPRPAHRLDANTSGLVVFSRTAHFAKSLQPQFEAGEVEKVYLARIQGHPTHETFSSSVPIASSAGALGARDIDPESGLPAHTDFFVLRKHHDGTSLVEARPRTGRTNQIRVHLWQLGWPIVGDTVYLPGRRFGDTQTIDVDAPPLCLHAWKLTFRHPLTQQRMTFMTDMPSWASE